jgi:hypothetical protein
MTTCQPITDERPVIETPETAEIQAHRQPAGQLLQDDQGRVYRVMRSGLLRQITDRPTYFALGYEPDDAITVADENLAGYSLGMPLMRWMTSHADPYLYFLEKGKRFRVPDLETMEVMGGTSLDVSLVPDRFLESFELASAPLPEKAFSEDEQAYPKPTAVLWAQGFLWTANETGLLTRWDVQTQNYEQYRLPGEPVIRALASDEQEIYAGTEGGDIWQITADGSQTQIMDSKSGWVSALAFDTNQDLWYADISHLDRNHLRFHAGPGLISMKLDQPGQYSPGHEKHVFQIPEAHLTHNDALTGITSLAIDNHGPTLWVGTLFAGLLGYNILEDTWQDYNACNSDLSQNVIHDIEVAPDRSLWLATESGVSAYHNGMWRNFQLADDLGSGAALAVATCDDNLVWVAGESYIAQLAPGETWQVYRLADNPLLSDRARFVVLDDENRPWFIGRRGKIHFDGNDWIAYDADVRRFAKFVPAQSDWEIAPPAHDFPSPIQESTVWLKTWPRPEADNGLCIHFLQTHQFDAIEAQRQVNRMKRLGTHWTLVHYADHEQMRLIAPIFQEAGITVIWRPFVRPYETYSSWAEDVEFLRSRGLPPYIQLYNEPSLAQEWDNLKPVDQGVFMRNLLPAARQVYDAGGYVGLQFVHPDWLRLTLRTLKEQEMSYLFERLFFIPHLYGLNHPPEYDEDINSALGFREYSKVFEEEIGFVPVMIAGEGGWRPGEAQDNRYPPVDEALHRDYHLAIFDWFRAGQLSNGEALPDYLFAFCPWLVSDANDPAAWFDSDSGDRTPTIEAIEAIPSFEREFSWDR